MTTFNKFDRDNLKEARELIQAKLDELAANGLIAKLGNISYDNDSFHVRMDVSTASADDEYAKEFNRHFFTREFPDAVGKEFEFNGRTCKFRGFKPRARTKQAVFEVDGGLRRTEFDLIKSLLAA